MRCIICGKDLSPSEGKLICDDCFSKLLKDPQLLKEKVLDQIDNPILVADKETTKIVGANENLLQFVGKPLDDVVGSLGGNVIGCIHADKLGGCGNTEFCSDCPLRNMVEETIEDNQSKVYNNIDMTLNSDGKVIRAKFDVSTKIKDGTVLIQINDFIVIDF